MTDTSSKENLLIHMVDSALMFAWFIFHSFLVMEAPSPCVPLPLRGRGTK